MNIYEKAVQGQLEAYNLHNVDEFLKWYTEDFKAFDFDTGELLIQGKDAAYEKYSELFKNELLSCKLINRIVLGRTIIDHEEVKRDNSEDRSFPVAIYDVEDSGLIKTVYFIFGNIRKAI